MTFEELGQYAACDYLTKVAMFPAGVQAQADANLMALTPKARGALRRNLTQGANEAAADAGFVAKTRRAAGAAAAKPMGWGGKAAIGAGILGAGALAHKVLSSPDPQQR